MLLAGSPMAAMHAVGFDALENDPELELQQIPCLESWDSCALALPSFPFVLAPVTSSLLPPSNQSVLSVKSQFSRRPLTSPSHRSPGWELLQNALASPSLGWGGYKAMPRRFPGFSLGHRVQGKVSCTRQTGEVPSDCSISAFSGLLHISYSTRV